MSGERINLGTKIVQTLSLIAVSFSGAVFSCYLLTQPLDPRHSIFGLVVLAVGATCLLAFVREAPLDTNLQREMLASVTLLVSGGFLLALLAIERASGNPLTVARLLVWGSIIVTLPLAIKLVFQGKREKER